jgi:hypothetical protein
MIWQGPRFLRGRQASVKAITKAHVSGAEEELWRAEAAGPHVGYGGVLRF